MRGGVIRLRVCFSIFLCSPIITVFFPILFYFCLSLTAISFLRSSVLGASWRFGNNEVAELSLEMFRAWMENTSLVLAVSLPLIPARWERRHFINVASSFSSIPADLRSVVYSAAIAHGSEEEWNFLWQWYLKTTSPDEKSTCLSALAKSMELWILARSVTCSHCFVQKAVYVFCK